MFFGVPLLIMAAPVLCMGASFPCAQALVSQRVETLGRHTGLLQFATMLLFLAVFPSNERLWAFLNGVTEHRQALAEDRSCATVLKNVDDEWVLTVNGASQNSYPFDDYHVLIGMMPTLMHPDPESGMALGLGIGATPYGLAVDPRLETITTVEICGGEIDLLEGLAADGALELVRFFGDPRQHLVVGDGRDHLLRTDDIYDVIVVDTLRPQSGFSGSLYSREFYELVDEHLGDGGMMAQWAPTARVTNTITEVFPHVVRFTVPQYFRSARDGFSDEQADRLEAFLTGVDLRPRDEYFPNNPEGVPERSPSCG